MKRLCLKIFFILFAAYFFGSFNAYSQLCSGSLGDPVVKIDFGGPGNFQPAPILTGYIYQNGPCPDDGYYTVTPSSPSCFNNGWHPLNTDHTGNGYFLLVNASYAPGDFFRQQITGLCPGTTYEFAAWILNMIRYNSIKPNLLFTIETGSGTILQSYTTGDIPESPTPRWNQYGFYFSTPANLSEVVLRIRNNAPGGTGNDLAIDDITFRPCGPKLNASISGIGTSASVCEENARPFLLEANLTPGYSNPSFRWQLSRDSGKNWQDITNATQITHTVNSLQPGFALYRLSAAEAENIGKPDCRITSGPIDITLVKTPDVDAGPNLNIFPGDTILFLASAIGNNLRYQWSPPRGLLDSTVLQAQCYLQEAQTYTLTASTPEGCTASDTMRVKPITGIYVPTAFTPNADGINDIWHIPAIDPSMGASVTVFNRYGQAVYQVENGNVNWDGNRQGLAQPTGVYVYLVRFKKGLPTIKGTLKLIR